MTIDVVETRRYAAKLLFQFRVVVDGEHGVMRTCEERILVLRASSARKALVMAKEALNGLEPRDVDRGYRWEQGFTLEMYMHEDSQKSRDAFVETGKAAKF